MRISCDRENGFEKNVRGSTDRELLAIVEGGMRRGIPRQGRPDPILTNRAPGGSQSRYFYTQAREIEAGADGPFVRFPREAATITDRGSSASPATPRLLAILLKLRVFFMAPLLAHNMTDLKPVSAWPRRKRSYRWFHNRRIKCLLYCGFWVYPLP